MLYRRPHAGEDDKAMRTVFGFILAVVVVVVVGAGAHAYFNQGALEALGATFTPAMRVGWIFHDITGMAPLYGAIMGVGLLIAFIVAGIVSSWMPSLRSIVYVVAGAVAVACAITVMGQVFGTTPIASTRSMDGFIGQAVAGALAGLAYVLVKRPA